MEINPTQEKSWAGYFVLYSGNILLRIDDNPNRQGRVSMVHS